ncbi:hypothetical protein Tco_0870606, partial [Tanacetum coccineum]
DHTYGRACLAYDITWMLWTYSGGNDEDSLDSDSGSEGAEDEGPAVRDEDPGMRDKVFSLGEDEVVLEGQQQAALVVETAVGEPLGLGYGALRCRELAVEEDQRQLTLTTWTDSEDSMIYIDVPTYPPPAPPVQTPPLPD